MRKKWTNEECNLLSSVFYDVEQAEIIALFKDRSWRGISRKAQKMGLKRKRLNEYYIDQIYEKSLYKTWFMGEMLSDGHIDKQGRYAHTTKYAGYAKFLKQKFANINVPFKISLHNCFDKRTNKIYKRFLCKTPSVFKYMRMAWYPYGYKIIPDSLTINDEIFGHMILGDGTIGAGGDGFSIATMCFSDNDICKLGICLTDYGLTSMRTLKNRSISFYKTKVNKDRIARFLMNFRFPMCYLYKRRRLAKWCN